MSRRAGFFMYGSDTLVFLLVASEKILDTPDDTFFLRWFYFFCVSGFFRFGASS